MLPGATAVERPSLGSVPLSIRRLVQYPQWDIDYGVYQLLWLLRSPRQVYKLTQHRKQTKNQWARDDPAFVVVLTFFLMVSAIAFGVAFQVSAFAAYVHLIVQNLLQFLGGGVVVASTCWFVANRYMRVAHVPHSVEQEVEWLYAFDVHCNSYVPVLMLLHVLQYFLLPVVVSESFAGVFVANTLYALALVAYCYITLAGYMVLPFLQNTNMFLLPVFAILVWYVLFLVLQLNVSVMGFRWALS